MTVFTIEQVDRPIVRWPTSDFTDVQIAVLFVALTLLISVPKRTKFRQKFDVLGSSF